jgi:hypothetical protein
MAKDEKLEIQWVTFIADVRIATQSSQIKALVRTEAAHLRLGYIAGLPFVIVEDKALPCPATIPWGNVASVGWVDMPAISGFEPKEKVLK